MLARRSFSAGGKNLIDKVIPLLVLYPRSEVRLASARLPLHPKSFFLETSMSAIHEMDRAFMPKGSPSNHGSSLPSRTRPATNWSTAAKSVKPRYRANFRRMNTCILVTKQAALSLVESTLAKNPGGAPQSPNGQQVGQTFLSVVSCSSRNASADQGPQSLCASQHTLRLCVIFFLTIATRSL